MEYADGKVKDLQIAYIGGGSRGYQNILLYHVSW